MIPKVRDYHLDGDHLVKSFTLLKPFPPSPQLTRQRGHIHIFLTDHNALQYLAQ